MLIFDHLAVFISANGARMAFHGIGNHQRRAARSRIGHPALHQNARHARANGNKIEIPRPAPGAQPRLGQGRRSHV